MGEKESVLPPGSRLHSNGCSTAASIELPSFSVNYQQQRNRLPFSFKPLDSTPEELFAYPVDDENIWLRFRLVPVAQICMCSEEQRRF